LAPAAPQPSQEDAREIRFRPQDSPAPQEPAVVEQPEAGVHTASQQPLALHVVWAGVQAQPAQPPEPSQYRVHWAP
jgi:hypothetical protein